MLKNFPIHTSQAGKNIRGGACLKSLKSSEMHLNSPKKIFDKKRDKVDSMFNQAQNPI